MSSGADGRALVAQGEPKQRWTSQDGIRWSRDDEASLAPANAQLEVPGFDAAPKLGPSAEKLERAEASWFDGSYLEIDGRKRGTHSGVWVTSGTLKDGFREQERLDFDGGCGWSRVSGFDHRVYAACANTRFGDDDVRIYLSIDGGRHFRREPYTFRAKFDELRLAAGADGALVLSGACEGEKCEPTGIFHRERKGQRLKRPPRQARAWPAGAPVPLPKPRAKPSAPSSVLPPLVSAFDLFASSAPPFSGPLLWLAAAPDGKHFAAVATTLGAQGFVLLRSSDGGRSFVPTLIPGLVPSNSLKPPRNMAGPAADHGVTAGAYDDMGSVTIVIDGQWIVMARYDGQMSVHPRPAQVEALGVYGQRVLALDTSGSRGWESSDAGATWSSVAVPKFPCPSMTRRCAFAVHCTNQLCFVGSDYTRTAWGTPR